MTSKIDIELKYHLNRCNLSEYIELHSAKIHERNVILVTLDGYLVGFWNVRAKGYQVSLVVSGSSSRSGDRGSGSVRL